MGPRLSNPRGRRGVLLALLGLAGLLTGCTRSYAPVTDAATRELRIEAGDEIRVVTTRRERLSFRVGEVRDDRFIGVTVEPRAKERRPAGETVEVPFEELAVLQVIRFDARTAAVASATYAPSMPHPTLTIVTEVEKTMDCRQLDQAIDRADTVRWLIRDDGARLETSEQRGARYAANVVMIPLIALRFFPPFMGAPGHAVLNNADVRIRELLTLKRDHGCPARPAALPGMDDMALLGELESVQSKIAAGEIDDAALLEQRTRLLDGLRIVPPLGGSESALPR